MTRRTPDFLRQRSSNLSLRMAATTAAATAAQLHSSASSVSGERTEATGPATKAYILADLHQRPHHQREVCSSCYDELESERAWNALGHIPFGAAQQDRCELCSFRKSGPAAYTKPFTNFLTENPTIFDAVDYFKGKLSALGFKEVGCPHHKPISA